MTDQARDLESLLRLTLDGQVAFDDYSRHLFSRDASMYAIRPLGVAFPRHSDDVAAAVSACATLGVPVVPRGAGTSLAGQTVGPGLVLDMSRHLDRIHEIDPEARTALVDVGERGRWCRDLHECDWGAGLQRDRSGHGFTETPEWSERV